MIKKLFTFKSPVFFVFLLGLMALFAIFAKYTHIAKQSCRIDFSLITPEPVDFSIYYNVGRGLNQKDYQTKYIDETDTETKVGFCIPVYSKIVDIRFDPATGPISMQISDISLSYSNGSVFNVPFDSLVPNDQIGKYSLDNGILHFETREDANDPIFSLTSLQKNEEKTEKRGKFLHYALWLASAVMISFVGRFIYFFFFLGT